MFAQYHVTFTLLYPSDCRVPCELLSSDVDEVISFIDERFSRGDLLGVSINLYPVGKRLIDMCGWMDIPTRPSVEPQRLTYFDLHDIADDLKYPVVNKSITCLIVN